MKETISTVTGVAAGVISWLVGGLDTTILALVICMGVDYVTGLIVAGIFHNSPKTPSGGLDSRVGWKGLARKFVTLLIVVVQISWTRCWAWAMSGMRSSWGSVPTSASASWKMRGSRSWWSRKGLRPRGEGTSGIFLVDRCHRPGRRGTVPL